MINADSIPHLYEFNGDATGVRDCNSRAIKSCKFVIINTDALDLNQVKVRDNYGQEFVMNRKPQKEVNGPPPQVAGKEVLVVKK